MKTYMVEAQMPYNPPQEFFALIPTQRSTVAELMSKRIFLSYTLSADRMKLWVVITAQSETDAREILSQQPMDKYFTYTSFRELMFHEMAGLMFPQVSLN